MGENKFLPTNPHSEMDFILLPETKQCVENHF